MLDDEPNPAGTRHASRLIGLAALAATLLALLILPLLEQFGLRTGGRAAMVALPFEADGADLDPGARSLGTARQQQVWQGLERVLEQVHHLSDRPGLMLVWVAGGDPDRARLRAAAATQAMHNLLSDRGERITDADRHGRYLSLDGPVDTDHLRLALQTVPAEDPSPGPCGNSVTIADPSLVGGVRNPESPLPVMQTKAATLTVGVGTRVAIAGGAARTVGDAPLTLTSKDIPGATADCVITLTPRPEASS